MVSESHHGSHEETRAFRMLSRGTIISHYEIMEKIGEGGMGVVYKALDTKLNRPVVLKFLPPRLLCDAEARARFEHEAKSASAISHANITTIHEIDEVEGQCFISMEYVEGRTIKEISGGKPPSIEEILTVAIQIGEGLKSAHQKGVIHRDVKSANILLSNEGVVKITDFGLAKLRGATKLTKTGTTLGTLQYMSPEQAQGKDVDARSDLFSFGVVIYEMITGRLPFGGEYEQAIVYSILNDTPEPLARFKSGLPDGLQRIVDKALAKDRDERYQDAADMLADLRREKRVLEQAGAAHISTEAPAGKSWKRHLKIVIPAAAVAVGALFLFVLEPFRIEMGPREEAAARENSLAIMYFENLADRDDPHKLGEIVTNLLVTDLSESRYMSVVSTQRLYDILKFLGMEGAKAVDREVASEVATRARARLMLLGSILQTEPAVVVTAQLVEVESGKVRASQRVMGEAGEEIFTLVDRLAAEVRGDLSLPPAAQDELDRPVADVTTHSPEAYGYYLEGMDYIYKYSWAEAERCFEMALEYDSTFAMAYYGLARATRDEQRDKEMMAKAVEYSDGVSQKERRYINARVARMIGDPDQAIEELKKILERDPDDKTALEGFASIYQTRLQFEAAIDCFKRVIEVDPLHKEAYNGLAYAYHRVGDFDKSVWAADKYVSLAPDEHNPYDTRGDIYAWNGRLDQALESYRKALEIRPDFDPTLAKLGHIYLFKREYARAESLYRALCASTDKGYRSEGRTRLAFVAAYQGKFEEALETLDAGIMADRMERSEYWLPDKYQARSEIYLERDEITRAIEEFEKTRETAYRLWPDELVYWDATYVMLLAENHEIARAEDLAEAIRKHFETENDAWECYYWLAAGWLERAKGDLGAALTDFEKAAKDLPRFRERYILARTYQESGRLGDAATEFEEILSDYGETRANEPIWAAKAFYLLGLAYEQSGWNKKAIEQYKEFLEIWSDADPGIPEVEDARQRLVRLQQSRGGSEH